MENNLVQVLNQDGQLVVSSRQVAENFDKEHKTVLRAIGDLVSNLGVAQNCADLFIEEDYQHEQNKQWYKEYLLTRDGFSLIVMAFTGAKALQWKLKYIEAFNKMEQQLREQQPAHKIPQTLSEALMFAGKLALEKEEADEAKRIAETRSNADMCRAMTALFNSK